MTNRINTLNRKKYSSTRESEHPDDIHNDSIVVEHLTEKRVEKSVKQPSTLFLGIVIVLFLFTSVLLSGAFIYSSMNLISEPEENKIEAIIYSSKSCGCCHMYVDYLEKNNFEVNHTYTDRIDDIKDERNIPEDLRSCAHISIIGNYSVEGHVPIEAIKKLLDEIPDIDGIALPGMPGGSPGMSGTKVAPFEIIAFKDSESVGVFVSI